MEPADPSDPETHGERAAAADKLRGDAAACRTLAVRARTEAGSTALDALGAHFDDQARRIDPSSQRR